MGQKANEEARAWLVVHTSTTVERELVELVRGRQILHRVLANLPSTGVDGWLDRRYLKRLIKSADFAIACNTAVLGYHELALRIISEQDDDIGGIIGAGDMLSRAAESATAKSLKITRQLWELREKLLLELRREAEAEHPFYAV